MNNILIIILLLLNVIFFSIGYILGRIYNNNNIDKPVSFLKSNNSSSNTNKNATVNIDDKKVVIPIKTQDLEKKYDTLGSVTTISDNISESVNKLKNLKR